MISRKSKYAVIAALNLARHADGEPRLISQIAEEERIPKKFLETILLELKNAGILGSRKGKGGGYHLAKPKGDVTIGSILRIINGPLAPVSCVSQTAQELCDECKEPEFCSIRQVMKEVRDATTSILDRATLGDMLEREEKAQMNSAGNIMYHI